MKKYIFSIIALVALTTFIACSSDDDQLTSHSTTADKAFEGTYSGTWTVTWTDKNTNEKQTETPEGTITIASDSTGVVDITFDCPTRSLNAKSVANIWYAGNGFQFAQNVTTANVNALAVPFSGKSYDGVNITAAMTINQRVGRSTTTFYYTFAGKKN